MKIFKTICGLKRLNDATGSDSLELSDKMWLIYLYFGRVFSVSIYARIGVKVKVKVSRDRPEVALEVPGR